MQIVLIVAALALLGAAVYDSYSSGSSGTGALNLFGLSSVTSAQIAQYAANAGFSGPDLVTAVAIALAESSGNPNAYNPETAAGAPSGLGSYGLWQIYLNANPQFSGENLYDPQINANAAFALYEASGFSPWATYQSGAYLTYTTEAQTGVYA